MPQEKAEQKEEVFWAERLADQIMSREKFEFTDEKIPKLKNWTVKSSSSLSGVLHIGRLSDLVRGEAVYRALKEKGFPVEFIYVMEDMDPLRKVPKGVPASFEQYIGFPVSDVPDPEGCHKSYGEHFISDFLNILPDFLQEKPKILSMREEYKKGSFTNLILALVNSTDKARDIIQGKQDSELAAAWSPWKPICDKCGNLQTTEITNVSRNKVDYVCKDYAFEKFTAKGCGHKGTADLRKANGKLVWKSEWAAQWKHWQVCAEGAGKEYEARNSAFWVNAEICEKVLNFPHPEPIFYEHITVDGVKMSASLGNVVYPKDWLETARPETLKYFYMKRLMKSRSFSWKDLPNLELELDRLVEEGGKKIVNYSTVKDRALVALPVDYALIAYLVQLFPEEEVLLEKLKEMGYSLEGWEEIDAFKSLRERIGLAKNWIGKRAPEDFKIKFLESLGKEQKKMLDEEAGLKEFFQALIKELPAQKTSEEIQQLVFDSAKKLKVRPKIAFRALYLVLLGKGFGPKIGSLILAFGKEKVLARLKEALA